mgnify:CR=1 FL=1
MFQLLLVFFSLVMPFTSSNEVGDPYTVGDKVEEWTLKGAFLTGAAFGELDWSDDGTPLAITLDIQFDHAILQY